jgi:hypothetical protein
VLEAAARHPMLAPHILTSASLISRLSNHSYSTQYPHCLHLQHHEHHKERQTHHLHRLRFVPVTVPSRICLLTPPSITLLLVRLHQHQKVPSTPPSARHRSRNPPILPRRSPRRRRQPIHTDTAMETSIRRSRHRLDRKTPWLENSDA